ncbi:hypothetical protein ADUPG1_013818 [Aduncisulcus paluster]|uniref:Uncharacterized protein n=1 Tax=Aduncisulcus paluster TaxID=2918883 RepID=A0ABQ5K7I8_9EUKA|nr:hypothetical protein ADUPG1_013818 [Aduncisulcus paluster]
MITPSKILSIAPYGYYIFSGNSDKSIRGWNWLSGKQAKKFVGSKGPVTSLLVDNDRKLLYSASWDGKIRCWSLTTFSEKFVFSQKHSDYVKTIIFSHDKRVIISASSDSTVRIWDALRGECVAVLEGHKRAVETLEWIIPGKILVSAGSDVRLCIWDVSSAVDAIISSPEIKEESSEEKISSSVPISSSERTEPSSSVSIPVSSDVTSKESEEVSGESDDCDGETTVVPEPKYDFSDPILLHTIGVDKENGLDCTLYAVRYVSKERMTPGSRGKTMSPQPDISVESGGVADIDGLLFCGGAEGVLRVFEVKKNDSGTAKKEEKEEGEKEKEEEEKKEKEGEEEGEEAKEVEEGKEKEEPKVILPLSVRLVSILPIGEWVKDITLSDDDHHGLSWRSQDEERRLKELHEDIASAKERETEVKTAEESDLPKEHPELYEYNHNVRKFRHSIHSGYPVAFLACRDHKIRRILLDPALKFPMLEPLPVSHVDEVKCSLLGVHVPIEEKLEELAGQPVSKVRDTLTAMERKVYLMTGGLDGYVNKIELREAMKVTEKIVEEKETEDETIIEDGKEDDEDEDSDDLESILDGAEREFAAELKRELLLRRMGGGYK